MQLNEFLEEQKKKLPIIYLGQFRDKPCINSASPSKIKKKKLKEYNLNKEKYREYQRNYYRIPEIREKRKEYQRNRYKNSPEVKQYQKEYYHKKRLLIV